MITVERLIMDAIYKRFPEYTVVGEYQDRYNEFPVITVNESQNSTFQQSMTNMGEEHAEITFDIQVYDNGIDRRTNTMDITKEVNDFFLEMGFVRIITRTLHNLHDSTISRTMTRYRGIISKELYVYTR